MIYRRNAYDSDCPPLADGTPCRWVRMNEAVKVGDEVLIPRLGWSDTVPAKISEYRVFPKTFRRPLRKAAP